MKPAKITIQGDFWDCQIYRGRLYLWKSDGALKIVDWENLVRSFIKNVSEELALTCAFLDGRFLYSNNLKVLFQDIQFKEVLTQKFEHLIERDYVIEEKDLDDYLMGEQNNPFNELQTDSEILNNTIYSLTYAGLISVKTHLPSKLKNLVQRKIVKISDIIGFSLKAGKYGRLALSSGDEGLYEYNAQKDDYHFFNQKDRMQCISNKHSSFADFNFLSLYNSSIVGKSFLSLYKIDENITNDFRFASSNKRLEKEIDENIIFGSNSGRSISWGTNEKLYKAENNVLEVVNFNNYAKDDNYFSKKNKFEFQPWKGKILKGGTAYFGTIVECENAIVVLTGVNEFYNIKGAATRWRVYPRSFNYENHLHVIQDDRIDIYSFNNDYFRDQKTKDFGIKFTDNFSSFFKK